MITLFFKKTFTSGILKGRTIREELRFTDGNRADEWVKRVNASRFTNYRVTVEGYK